MPARESDVPVDRDRPVRGKNIAGRIWYWWRMCQASRCADAAALSALLRREQAWRGVVGVAGQDPLERKVKIRVNATVRVQDCWLQPPNGHARASTDAPPEGMPGLPGPQSEPSLGYVSWMAGRVAKLPAPDPRKGCPDFELTVEVPDELAREQVLEALRWWASFDGVCARRSRGFGAVHVELQTGDTWAPLQPVAAAEAEAIGAELVERPDLESSEPIVAWDRAVALLRSFRQPPGGWPRVNRFQPRLALGSPMPLASLGKGWRYELADRKRLPSPVVVKARAISCPETGLLYRPVALRLPLDLSAVFSAEFAMKHGNATIERGRVWPNDPAGQALAAQQQPFAGGSVDPVSALMRHFGAASL